MIEPVMDALTTPVILYSKRHQTNDQLRRIAKCRIEKAADGRTGADCQLFASPAHPAGQRHNRNRRDDEKEGLHFRHAGTYRIASAIGTASSSKSSGVATNWIFARVACFIGAWPAPSLKQLRCSQAPSNLRYARSLGRKLVNRTVPVIATVNGCAVKGSDAVTDHASIGKSPVRRALEAMSQYSRSMSRAGSGVSLKIVPLPNPPSLVVP